MALVVLGFISILLVTFALVLAMTRKSTRDKSMDQRMESIRVSARNEGGVTPETPQLLKATKTGSFGWLDELLEPYAFTQNLKLLILQANSSTTPATLILKTLAFFVAGYVVVFFFVQMFLLDFAGGAILGFLPFGFLSFKRSRNIKAFNAVLAECIDMMSRALRAGHSLSSAIEMIAEDAQEPARSEFGEIFRQLNLGLPLREALMQLLDRIPSPDLRVLVTAILVQKDTGGNLVEILDRTVFVIRERLRIQGEIRVQTSAGRFTGWILSALPVIMLVLINIINPGYSTVLLHDPLGRKIIYAGLGMLSVGAFFINRIVSGIEV
jgi:tight adherence protein B